MSPTEAKAFAKALVDEDQSAPVAAPEATAPQAGNQPAPAGQGTPAMPMPPWAMQQQAIEAARQQWQGAYPRPPVYGAPPAYAPAYGYARPYPMPYPPAYPPTYPRMMAPGYGPAYPATAPSAAPTE